jgi:nickel-dependent lactate racemase
VIWEAAEPARVASSGEAKGALERIARRIAIELETAKDVLVLLNDETREVNPDLAACVLSTALAGGQKVRVLFARGSHKLPTPDAHLDAVFSRLGGTERRALEVSHHDARRSPFVEVAGLPLHRLVAESEHTLALGSVEPHYFAGWTGAHKTATIGVMGFEGIEANHEGALDAASKPLALEGNPVFDGVARVANALGERLFCLNEVHADHRIVAWSAGRWRAALEQVVPEASTVFVREASAPVDLLVASVEGPLARDLYQAEKGIKNAEICVKDGGAVVLHAACPAGAGPDRFLQLLAAARTHEEALRRVAEDGYRLGDHKAVKLRALEARGVAIHLACPGIAAFPEEAKKVEDARLSLHASLEEALAAAVASRVVSRGLLVRDAGNLVVRLPSPVG